MYAIGGNPQSALLMGVNVKRTKFLAHVLCGLLAGIGGLLYTLFAPSGNPGNGYGYEIDAISSSVIGGVMLSGGVGLPIGTFFGVLINALIERVVPLLGIVDASCQNYHFGISFAFIVLQSVFAEEQEGVSLVLVSLRQQGLNDRMNRLRFHLFSISQSGDPLHRNWCDDARTRICHYYS